MGCIAEGSQLVGLAECLRTGWYTRMKRCVLREIREICVR